MNRAAALRELGLLREAREELGKLLPELDQDPATDSYTKGRARYHLALCQWRLGDRAGAQRSAEESLAAYDGAPKDNPIDPGLRQQSEVLLADVKNGLPPPPLAAIDAPAALEAARARYRAREALTKLALDQHGGSACWTSSSARPGRPRRSSPRSTGSTASFSPSKTNRHRSRMSRPISTYTLGVAGIIATALTSWVCPG